jgi:hypothetical protein
MKGALCKWSQPTVPVGSARLGVPGPLGLSAQDRGAVFDGGSVGAVHGGGSERRGNGGEEGLPVVGVDNSRFWKVAKAQASDEVVVVVLGHGPRRLKPVTPLWRMEWLVSGS